MGEAHRYDPYSQFGHIMLYEIDSFGFVPGFIKKWLRLMSEDNLMSEEEFRKSLEITKYDIWRRYNLEDLISEYDRMFEDRKFFDSFCKNIYKGVLENENKHSKKNF